MNLTINSKELAEGVISVAKALPARASMPILDGIYLQATSDGLKLKCTDMMLQKECVVAADVWKMDMRLFRQSCLQKSFARCLTVM